MENTKLLVLYLDYIKEMNKQVQKHKRINLSFICQGITSIQTLLNEYKFHVDDRPLVREFNDNVSSFIKTSKSKLDEDYKNIIFFNIKNLQIPC